jgi:replicative DNA helicase
MQNFSRSQDNLQLKFLSTEKALGKSLPFSMEAERAVLGALLLNDERAADVIQLLSRNDFYSQAHRILYDVLIGLIEKHKHLDLIMVKDELEKRNELETVGGLVYLLSLQEDIAAIGLIEHHARIIKEKSILRDLIASATKIITNCYAQDDKAIEAVLDEAEQTIFEIANKKSKQNFVQLNIWLRKTVEQLVNLKGNRQGITGVSSGYQKLDQYTSGFQPGDFIVLAARPSMGKTALALSLAKHAAEQGNPIGFFSLEMSAEQLTVRLISAEAQVPHQHIRNATVNSDEWMSVTSAAAKLSEMKIFIDDTPLQTILDIRTKSRKLKADHQIQLLVVDYLQLLNANGRYENRHQEVSAISRALKALAKELSIPIIALSQLSRAVDSRLDKRPMLSDLRESGAIEQDADLIMFLYRDVVYNQETEDPSLAEVIIGKQRNGPTGTVYLTFKREFTTFEDGDF